VTPKRCVGLSEWILIHTPRGLRNTPPNAFRDSSICMDNGLASGVTEHSRLLTRAQPPAVDQSDLRQEAQPINFARVRCHADAYKCRSAYRLHFSPRSRSYDFGFASSVTESERRPKDVSDTFFERRFSQALFHEMVSQPTTGKIISAGNYDGNPAGRTATVGGPSLL